jgi:outer membrane protein assembly factor BamD (BamD/ComL family)
MIKRFSVFAVIAAAFHLSSCGTDTDLPMMAGTTRESSAKGEELFKKAKTADDAGKKSKAIKYYEQAATRYPFAPSSAKARYRQAQLLDEKGSVFEAFDAYDQFLASYPGSNLYTAAIKHQADMAQSAANGDLKSSILGIKTKLPLDKMVEMLGKVRDQAPKSATASEAQYTIAKLYESRKKSKEATAAYRQLVKDLPNSKQAPDALFEVGIILVADADTGNQNQANIDLAKEAFNDYLIQYPGHSRNAEARTIISGLTVRDDQRSFDIAQFYEKTGKIDSAKVYYHEVTKHATSGPLHDKALARLKALGE